MSIDIEIDTSVFNDVYKPFLHDEHRFLIFYGGAGSGKSVFVAQRYIYKLLTQPKCNLLCVRAVGNTLRDSVFAELCKVIKTWNLKGLFDIKESEMRIRCLNGNEVLMRGLDDVEKLKSVTFVNGELTDVWIEEASEVKESDFNQLNVRLRGQGTKKQIVVSFNPIDVNHWLKKKFFDKKNDKAAVLHTTYKDNKFLDEEYKEELESYKETDPYYYDVYCRGLWGVYGKTIFNAQAVNGQIEKNIKPKKVGYYIYDLNENGTIKSHQWIDDENGYIAVYKTAESYVPYVLGGDTAGEGSDFLTAYMIDNRTGELAVRLRGQMDEDIYTYQIACLGMDYNNALLAVEANFSTYPIKKLQEISYPRQYIRQQEDKITHKLVESFGFRTTSLTRPIILSNIIAIARENIELFIDKDTLFEMLTFVRNDKGRMEAQEGSHDDLIMAMAIAYYARSQQSFVATTPPPKEEVKEIYRRKGQWIVNG